ncbi:MAG: SDR family oxidoreductase [Flavisolibacter sp.]
METVLVTGANGFVAHYLVQLLLQQNYRVIATGRGPCRLPFTHNHFQYECMDFTDKEEVELVLDKYLPDVIIHCGAMSAPDACDQDRETAHLVNVTGTENLLQKASQISSFFVYLSTDFVFDGHTGMYSEEDPTGPVNYYGHTKLMGEYSVKKYLHDWAIIRTVLVYGKPLLNRQNLVTNTANALQLKKPLKIFDDQVRTPTYVEDLAGALVTLVEKKCRGIYHVSGDDVLTPYQMAIQTAKFLSLDASLITRVEAHEWEQPAARPLKTGFNISKARKDLDYNPISFEEGLRKTFENGIQ